MLANDNNDTYRKASSSDRILNASLTYVMLNWQTIVDGKSPYVCTRTFTVTKCLPNSTIV